MAERKMFHINEKVEKPQLTRREILVDIGKEGALDRPLVTRAEFFENNNIARIVENVQDTIENVIIDKNFVQEVLELMRCIHKSRPNWNLNINELNSSVVDNIVQNIQYGDKLSNYTENRTNKVQHKSANSYLYDIEYRPRPVASENYANISTAKVPPSEMSKMISPITTLQPKDIATSTLYQTAKQTNNYREFYLHIDSRDRDVFSYPTANKYTIKLLPGIAQSGFVSNLDQRQVKDVVEVRLIDAIIPNIFASSRALPTYKQSYLFMAIDEFDGESYSTSRSGKRMFGKLRFSLSSLPIPQISFVNMECEGCVRKWWYKDPRGEYQNNQTPYPKLDTLSINLLDYDGQPFNFGTDTLSIVSVTYGITTTIETAQPHGLATNDLIYLRNIFNPVAPLGDGMINTNMTVSSGFSVDAIVSATEFTIAIDTSALGPFQLDTAMVVKANLQHSLTFLIRSLGGS